MEETRPIPAWQTTVIEALKANGVRAVGHVPDLVLAGLIRQAEADDALDVYAPAREEEGVGVLCGAYLGGQRGVLLMQNSGVGNLVNALASLAVPNQIPFLMLISERGALHEFNPAQVGMAQCLRPVLDALGVPHVTLSRPEEVRPVVDGACALAFSTERPVALVLSPLLTGGKKGLPAYEDEQPALERSGRGGGRGAGSGAADRLAERGAGPQVRMRRQECVGALVGALREELVVTGLGYAAFDVYAAGDRARNFYLSGALGSAAAVAFGLAAARPADRVVCVDGEGSLLANLGVLATIGRYGPPNLTCVILDNEMFQITGGQATHTAWGTDLALVAAGCGIESAHTVATLEDFRAAFERLLRTPGPHCLVAKVDRQRSAGYQPRKGVLLKYRFMGALGTHPDVEALAWE
ncbi:MAG TPA: thiamine pyrophosphate-dependent enzyme [Chloroflexota bacterium]|jgi:sulfopyruvate decarboxylase alpha subunit|nr:thiamine pyrophosphate-dependent enzyme [Chloroflexota bacterium]